MAGGEVRVAGGSKWPVEPLHCTALLATFSWQGTLLFTVTVFVTGM